MSLRLDRIMRAIERFGQVVTIEGVSHRALLRPIAIGQLQTYVTSGGFASWERPVYAGIFQSTAVLKDGDEFVGPDFEGKIRQVNPIRLAGEMVAKQAIIQVITPPVEPPLGF